MSVARGNWRRKKKITRKIIQRKLDKLVQSYRNNSTELIDKIYLCPYIKKTRTARGKTNIEHTIFSATPDEGCKVIELPRPMVYWDAVDYASGLLEADTDISSGRFEVFESMEKLIGALDVKSC